MSTRPSIFTERTSVNLPEGTRERLQEIAVSKGMSPATYIRMAVISSIQADETGHDTEQRMQS